MGRNFYGGRARFFPLGEEIWYYLIKRFNIFRNSTLEFGDNCGIHMDIKGKCMLIKRRKES
jgi:hypothetical protein